MNIKSLGLVSVTVLACFLFLSPTDEENDHMQRGKIIKGKVIPPKKVPLQSHEIDIGTQKSGVKAKKRKLSKCEIEELQYRLVEKVRVIIKIKDEIKKDDKKYNREEFLKIFKEYGLIEIPTRKVWDGLKLQNIIEDWEAWRGTETYDYDHVKKFTEDKDFLLTLEVYKKYTIDDFEKLDEIRNEIIGRIKKDDRIKEFVEEISLSEARLMLVGERCPSDEGEEETEKKDEKNSGLKNIEHKEEKLFGASVEQKQCNDSLCDTFSQWALALNTFVFQRWPATGKGVRVAV